MMGVRQQRLRRLLDLAAMQHGYFTAAQARQVQYSYQAQKFHVDSGNWERVDRGVYRIPYWPTESDDELVRWTLWSTGTGVVSHETALALHDLADVNPDRIHLTMPKRPRRQPAVLIIHRGTVPPTDIEERMGYSVTKPGRTIADCAEDGLAQEQIKMAVVTAFERGIITPHLLRDSAARIGSTAELGVARAIGDTPA